MNRTSKGLTDSIIASLAFPLLPLLVNFVDQADRADDVGSVNRVRPAIIDLLANASLLDH